MSRNILLFIWAMLIIATLVGIIFEIKYNKYDLTGDGAVNSADMLKLQKYIISQEHKYDVNQDGIVDERDYIEIKEYVMGE